MFEISTRILYAVSFQPCSTYHLPSITYHIVLNQWFWSNMVHKKGFIILDSLQDEICF